MSHIADELGFECYQLENGIWIKERSDGRRGQCVADEAVLWQALQAATGGKPQPTVDVAELVRENEQLAAAYERLKTAHEALEADWRDLCKDTEALRMRCEEWRREHEVGGQRVAELVRENERIARERDETLHQLVVFERKCAKLVKENDLLAKENERLQTEVEVWSQEYAADVEVLKRQVEALRVENEELQVANEAWRRECDRLVTENLRLQDNQRKRPGRKPRSRSDAGPAGGPEALPAHEGDPLDEDL